MMWQIVIEVTLIETGTKEQRILAPVYHVFLQIGHIYLTEEIHHAPKSQ